MADVSELRNYRKKPVVVQAAQWLKNGDHPQDESTMITPHRGKPFLSEGKVVRRFRHPSKSGELGCEHCAIRLHEHGWIDTKEGGHIVCPGDYVITGVKGEKYQCKPDIFAATYEPA